MEFIIISLTPFDYTFGSNIRDIAYELAKEHRVLYVNIPIKRSEVIRDKNNSTVAKRRKVIKGEVDGLEHINNNLWVLSIDKLIEPINFISQAWLFDKFNKLNNRRYAKSIQSGINRLEFNEYIFINDNDIYTGFYLKELLKPQMYVYYLRDMLTATDYWKVQAERLEPLLIAKSDITLTNSVYLKDYASKYNSNSYYVGQGCDIEHFANNTVERGEDLISIKSPIIGYFGALDSNRLDIPLLFQLAKRKKEWSILLIGHEDELFLNSELHTVSNIHFLGPKQFEELPYYLYGFNVCINPQLLNKFTIGNYPRKVDEYLAAGKPVVATKTEGMAPFAEFTYLASTLDEYIEFISDALENNTPEKEEARREFALQHTWENSVSEMLAKIQKKINDMNP